MVLNFCNPIGAFCKGSPVRKRDIYPAFEVIFWKTLKQLQRFYSTLEHLGRTGNPIGAFCKGRKSETSIYPAFEVIFWKTLEQLQRFIKL